MNCLRYLRPVCPDVLDSGGPDFPGNQGKVLNAPQTVFRGPSADAVHLYPCTCGHENGITLRFCIFRQCPEKFYGRMQHRPRKIPGEQHVAAPSDMEDRLYKRIEVNVQEVFLIVIFDEYPAAHVHSERVHRLQAEIMSLFYHQDKYNNYSSQITKIIGSYCISAD